MRAKGKKRSDGAIRMVLWGAMALILLIGYLDANPVHFEKDEVLEAGATLIQDEANGDILIVVDYSAYPKDPESFDELDFSLAWYNTIQQEIGPVSIVDAAEFTHLNISKYRVVIITRSAAKSETWAPKLEGFVDVGNVLVLEMPEGDLRKTFSADGKSGYRDPQRITRVEGLPPDLLESLIDIPLHTRLIGSTNLFEMETTETLMTIDAIPVVYRKQVGKGWAITFDFDYGMLLTALQQGRPSEGFRLRNQRGSEAIETADLSVSDLLTNRQIPVADLLERFVVYGVIGESYPIVGLWPFFNGMDGALIVSHDERGIGDQSIWMADYEKSKFNGRSTYFIESEGEMTKEGLKALLELGVDTGLTWDRAEAGKGAFQPIGALGIEPLAQALSLEEQVARLKKRGGKDLPLSNVRISDHLWDRDWTAPFQAISAAGFRGDSSYAPPPGEVGYPFGTSLPFTPLDRNGLAFGNLLEFPVTLNARGAAKERSVLETLLERSQKGDHQAISVSFSPSAFRDHPSAELYLTWRDIYQLAHDRNHWITSIAKMLRLHLARRNSTLTSRFLPSAKVDNEDVSILRIETLAVEGGMYCSIPQRIGEKELVDARRRQVRIERSAGQYGATEAVIQEKVKTREIMVMGYPRHLLKLSKGFNAIDVIYR